jgi:hypothetical protein
MTANSPEITSLRAHVKAACDEFDLAIVFHEVWKPTAYCKDLHERMGVSYATHAFRVVRTALRREMLLALMRLWDTDSRAVRIDRIAREARQECIIDALAADRAAPYRDVEVRDQMKQDLMEKANKANALVDKYSEHGSGRATLMKLRRLRHKRLAHRDIEAMPGADTTDAEIESFYQDTSELVSLLLSVISGVGYDPQQNAEVYQHYSKFFWTAVRGERTEGHPNYRAPRSTK